MGISAFGSHAGETISEITLTNAAGVRLSLITWGAIIRSFKVPVAGTLREVTLGFDQLEPYIVHRGHIGALAGRVANRIGGGRFALDGRLYDLVRNQNGQHTLHGGGAPHAFGERNWRIVAHGADHATLALTSPDGDGGFPGTLDVSATFRLRDGLNVSLEIEARSKANTPVNIAQHSYFNLVGGGDVLDHQLVIDGDFYLPTDDALIPTGEIRAVAGTPFDFVRQRPIRSGKGQIGYDACFVLRGPYGALCPAATLSVPDLSMQLWTTEPGLQIYDAAKMAETGRGIDGRRFGPYSGLCLECQNFPDAVNRGHFPNSILRTDEVYRQRTDWRFTVSST